MYSNSLLIACFLSSQDICVASCLTHQDLITDLYGCKKKRRNLSLATPPSFHPFPISSITPFALCSLFSSGLFSMHYVGDLCRWELLVLHGSACECVSVRVCLHAGTSVSMWASMWACEHANWPSFPYTQTHVQKKKAYLQLRLHFRRVWMRVRGIDSSHVSSSCQGWTHHYVLLSLLKICN